MAKTDVVRRLTVGAELQPGGGADVRVWAPACSRIDLVIPSTTSAGTPRAGADGARADGHYRGFDEEARAGGRYWFRLDGERLRPDPASRFQPDGPHGPSAFVDPARVSLDRRRTARRLQPIGQVIYEMHVGTFTPEGHVAAAAAANSTELARTRHHRRSR